MLSYTTLRCHSYAQLLSVLPQDPYAQLEIANKIIAFAYSQKVAGFARHRLCRL